MAVCYKYKGLLIAKEIPGAYGEIRVFCPYCGGRAYPDKLGINTCQLCGDDYIEPYPHCAACHGKIVWMGAEFKCINCGLELGAKKNRTKPEIGRLKPGGGHQ